MNTASWPGRIVATIKGSFKFKLIILLSCMVTLAFALAGWLVYRLNVQLMEDEISKQFSIANEQALARLELTFQEVNRVSQSIILNPSIELFVRESLDPAGNLYTQFKNRKYVEEQLTTLQVDAPSIRSVFLFDENGDLAISSTSGASGEPGPEDLDAIMAKLEPYRGNLVWGRATLPSAIDPDGRRTVLIAARRMLSDKLIPYGTMVVVMEESLVSRVLRDLTANGNGKVLLLEPMGGMLYSNTSREEREPLMRIIEAGDPQYARLNGITYLFVRHRLEPAGFTLYGGVSLQEIQRKNKDIIHIFVFAGIGVVLLSALLITISSRTLLAPLGSLMLGLRRLRAGDFSARIRVRSGDELGYIGESFNDMAEQVGTLIDKVYLAQISQRESELKAIQAQLNPHYLHNLFNELYWKLYGEDQTESALLINAISEMLKYSLQSVQTDTTLGEELQQVRNYIKIQTELFTGEVETIIQAEESLLELRMMRCLLLPVVENVFVHAFRDMEEDRVLRIKAALSETALHIEVADNGCGMDEQALKTLTNDGDARPRNGQTGIGFKSVLRRIELVYGASYGVDIASAEGKGTTVHMRLPLKTIPQYSLEEETG
ncbi:histidine kinase [Saccharibacillus sp. CPCC 101409]|uniref:cache domain-containing sensor histidine kinase n=1 Tax=Saccharibacillus sp. CPCC 101409 TaxID=3058041 RepID=UPI0026723A65|nr:sensor histidine kinase [Saccharibacillus sp. CPCC 101409]MDO3411841.1 histidine kinase [Saccharibacillus sp. CPCC 101409]